MTGRTSIWAAVIEQALTDATVPLSPSAANRTYERLHQQRTREWFTRPHRDFLYVCHLAGLDASRVRKHAIPLIEAAIKRDNPQFNPGNHHQAESTTP